MRKITTNSISKIFGQIADKQFPRVIQNIINKSYIKFYNIDMQEFEPSQNYKSLNELFTRKLKYDRYINQSKDTFISPVDSFITEMGDLQGNTLLQVKGMEYNAIGLLGNLAYESKILNGKYINFYLSPSDYHSYHIPCDLTVLKAVHYSGKLLPVNRRFLTKQKNLFAENERAVLKCQTIDNKLIYIVLVGALNVGKMIVSFDKRIETNTQSNIAKEYTYKNLYLKKGECFGHFKMGSSIVMLFEKDTIKTLNIKDKKLQFGDVIGYKN